MIKINLVGERKRPAAPGPSQLKGIQEGANVGLWALVGLILAGVLVTLGHLYILNGKLQDMLTQVAEAEEEVKELEPYIREVEEYKAKKAELERKVQVIQQLKTNQRGPVQIMDRVSRALPELLWLTRMEVSPTTITISGEDTKACVFGFPSALLAKFLLKECTILFFGAFLGSSYLAH